MTRDLSRLLRPRTIAVVGGGAWCRNAVQQSIAMGFAGDIFCVHPTARMVEGIETVARIADLPCAPDAVFLGINRHATVEAVADLSRMGAGGAVCFASGFSEAAAEDTASVALQTALVSAAGKMPILGPNCYGFINALDGALLWPDQHGCQRVERGVAILTQSSNIAINLSMQRRALPISFVVTCGNMAQISQAEIAMSLLDERRVTAIGLHIEGFGDTAAWHKLALRARDRGVPLVALKVGASEQAQYGTVSHTASLAGSDAGADALLRRLGIARVHDLPSLLTTLLMFHCNGPLTSTALSSISCSGGEAGLVADMALHHAVSFPPLTTDQKTALRQALGPMVATSNPLDYHTYVWGDVEKMVAAWLPMAADHIALTLIVLDYPHTDPSAWEAATQAAIEVRRRSGRPVAVVATLPELLPEDVSAQLIAAGVTPLHGLREALVAAASAGGLSVPQVAAPLRPLPDVPSQLLTEAMAKDILAVYGVAHPESIVARRGEDLETAAADLRAPLALKAQGLAHKSEAGALRLGLTKAGLNAAAAQMPGEFFLVEEMVADSVTELLVGVTRDPAHGFVLTLAAGGVLTELWRDRTSLLLPVVDAEIRHALSTLRIYPVLCGFRGAPPADVDAIVATVLAVQDCVVARSLDICEIEINPLICKPDGAIAADTLITVADDTQEEGRTDVTHQDAKERLGP